MPTVVKGSAKWVISFDDGAWDATRNGRAFGVNYIDIDAALSAILRSKRYVKGDKISAYDENDIRTLIRY